MRRTVLFFTLVCVVLLLVATIARAQSPAPPPTPTPTLLQQTEKEIPWWLAGLAGLVFGGILVWLLRPAFERLGNTIAEGLSRLGSGWGFKKRYLTHLVEEHRCLNIPSLEMAKASRPVELERVYVSLRTRVPDVALGHRESPALDIGEAMAQNRRLVILGGPGTGKTTLLAYLTLTYARGQSGKRLGLNEKRLPILVPLRRLKEVLEADGAARSLPTYLSEQHADMHSPKGFFEKMLRAGKCLVLLDGLDEVADKRERQQMSEWVDRLVTIYPRNRYVVTSRPSGYDSASLKNDFTELHICNLTTEEIKEFAANWCLAMEIAASGEDTSTGHLRARKKAQGLVGAIEANPDVRRLAVNPLILSIIALVHRHRTLPRRRVDLYAECVDLLLGRWDEIKGLMGELRPAQKQAVLQPFALEMHLKKRREMPRLELEKHIARQLPKMGGQAADAADFVDEVRQRSGLLVEIGTGTYAFSHLTFQEYLAARQIMENKGEQGLLIEMADDEWWEEVTLLYAGMTDATSVVDALLPVGGGEDHVRLLLAGRCVAEAMKVEETTREQVVRRLEGCFAVCTGEQFLRTGQVLAEVAGEDSVDFFLRLARDDAERREAALWSLGEMSRQTNEALRERVIERLLREVRVPDDRLLLDLLRVVENSALWTVLVTELDARMIDVPAGEFLMGDKKRTRVGAFRIHKYPVTNAQYKRFVDATGHSLPRHWEDGMYPVGKAIHPVVYVTWHDAVAYAKWADKRLPTEEEWEKAARGTDGREYPWGDWEEGRCNTSETGIKDTTPVGKYSPDGDSPYGCTDMAGNVWEWTASEHEAVRGVRVLRGGSWNFDLGRARCSSRLGGYRDYSADLGGFRCVSPV
jgi:formylglycine-generating enzyme required for sulfatase activity